MDAWDLKYYQVEGPAWLDNFKSGAYTIVATMPPNTSKARFMVMLHNLLQDRFSIIYHY